jgi:hypothetical protein
MQVEIAAAVFLTYLFVRNLVMTSGHLISRSYTLPLWCSFTASLFGTTTLTIYLLTPLIEKLNCRIAIWGLTLGLGFSILFNNLILLHKAYIVLFEQKWIIYVGISLILPQVVYPFFIDIL